MSVATWARRERAPLTLALVAVLIEVATYVVLVASAPPGTRWLGDRMINAADQAVYLGDIEQIRDGANALENLYASAPEPSYWLFVHVPIGWLARVTGWSAVAAHEAALWLATIAAVFLLHAVSRRLTDRERDATLSTALVVFAGGLGWLGSGRDVPDLTTETFFHPTLTMSAHVPLSFGLLAYALSTLAADAFTVSRGRRLSGPAAMAALLLVHPYFAPLVGMFGALLLVRNGRGALAGIVPYAIAGVLALLPHLSTYVSNPSRRFLLDQNVLPLARWSDWLLAMAPWSILWLGRVRLREPITARERWLVLWALSIAVALLLPFEWKRKLTEGAGALAIWLAMPVVLALKNRPLVRGVPALVPVLMLAAVSPLLVHGAHLVLPSESSGDRRSVLYVPDDRFDAWAWIRTHVPPDAVVLVDDLWLAIWTPTYAERRVWIGHPHETPDFPAKRAVLTEIFRTGAPSRIRALLDVVPAGWILTRGAASAERVDGVAWRVAARFGEMTVFRRE